MGCLEAFLKLFPRASPFSVFKLIAILGIHGLHPHHINQHANLAHHDHYTLHFTKSLPELIFLKFPYTCILDSLLLLGRTHDPPLEPAVARIRR